MENLDKITQAKEALAKLYIDIIRQERRTTHFWQLIAVLATCAAAVALIWGYCR